MHPVNPPLAETSCLQNSEQSIPIYSVERFCEIKLQHNGWFLPYVAYLHQLQSIYKSVRNGPSSDEPGLMDINEIWDLLLQPIGEHFG
jgi:hypothetical protein